MLLTNRKLKSILLAAAVIVASAGSVLQAQTPDQRVVRIAELIVDPAHLAAYTAAVKEEMAESIRVEPGVLAIYSVAEKDKPNSLRFFEIYANDEAYRSHVASQHFKKYVAVTQPMILSRKLIETSPVQLSAKPQ